MARLPLFPARNLQNKDAGSIAGPIYVDNNLLINL